MRDPWEVLLGEAPAAARAAALEQALRGPGAAARLESALPDLLREPDEALLLQAVAGLAPLVGTDPAARRTLELLSRRPGPTRAPALRALRQA